MLTYAEISTLVDRIVERIDPDKVIVFGSYAKGTATAKSDLDLLVIKDTGLPTRLRSMPLLPIVADVLVHVDVHVYTPEEVKEYGKERYSFLESVLRTGLLVHPKDGGAFQPGQPHRAASPGNAV